MTEIVHSNWHSFAIELANRAGLTVCGHDVICEDISKPIVNQYVPLLEMNSEPGLKMHHFPTGGGKPVDVAAKILDELFP